MSKVSCPESWKVTNLGEIAEWGSGGTPSRKVASYYNGDIPWVKTGDLGPKLLLEASEFITEEGLKKSSAKYFPKDSVAIAMYGATIGKTSILGLDATTNQACAVGIPLEGLTASAFLYYLLRNEKGNFIAKGKGGAQPNISQTLIKQHEMALPSLAEQKAIAEKLDTLLAQVESTKIRLERIPKILKRFRQSVLAAAFRGDLTKQWRQQNPNTDWQKINFSELVDSFQNGLSKRRGKSGLETAVIRLADIDSQRVSRSDMRTIKLSEAEREKYSLEKNDILILRVNGSADLVGRFVLIETTDELAYCDHFIRLRVSSLVLPGWVRLLGDSFAFREHIRKATVSSAGQKTVSQKTLNSFQVALPTLEEQAVICARVASIFTFCDRVQDQVDLGCSRSERLDQSILAKAFRGELVPQDPNDEPASALLARTRERKQERPKVC